MTVAQLIQVLNTIENPDNIRVMTKNYEEGYDDISDYFRVVNMALNVHPEWFYGDHEMVSENHNYKDKEIVKAIIL